MFRLSKKMNFSLVCMATDLVKAKRMPACRCGDSRLGANNIDHFLDECGQCKQKWKGRLCVNCGFHCCPKCRVKRCIYYEERESQSEPMNDINRARTRTIGRPKYRNYLFFQSIVRKNRRNTNGDCCRFQKYLYCTMTGIWCKHYAIMFIIRGTSTFSPCFV